MGISVTVSVGRFHVVRRMLAAVGLPVYELHRSAVGQLRLITSGSAASLTRIPLAVNEHAELTAMQRIALWRELFGSKGRRGVAQRQVMALRAREKVMRDARLSRWLSRHRDDFGACERRPESSTVIEGVQDE